MPYKLVYLSSASDELCLIDNYLAEEISEQVADKFVSSVQAAIASLDHLPKRHPRYSPMPVYHFLPTVYDYIIFYIVNDEKKEVQIHHILHGHRNIVKFLQNEKDG